MLVVVVDSLVVVSLVDGVVEAFVPVVEVSAVVAGGGGGGGGAGSGGGGGGSGGGAVLGTGSVSTGVV